MSEINKVENTAENSASIFKPDTIEITLGSENFSLVFDMNAFVELEKIYGNMDAVIKMILGKSVKEHVVKDGDVVIDAKDITVDGRPLTDILASVDAQKSSATTTDTLNILYCGLMHDLAIYNNHGEITGYKMSKQKVGSFINFKNIKDINIKLVMAFIQDLIPSSGESKNETGAEAPEKPALHYSGQ